MEKINNIGKILVYELQEFSVNGEVKWSNNKIDESLVTLELNNQKNIVQIKGEYNLSPLQFELYIIEEWTKGTNLTIQNFT